MHHLNKLTSAEVGNLWNSYMANSMSHCMFKHFLNNIEDKSIQKMLVKADRLSLDIVKFIQNIFSEDHIPVPHGFNDLDINPDAARLFSDSFYLHYIDMMIKLGSIFYAIMITTISQMELRQFFTARANDTFMLANAATELMQEKGLHIHSPLIPVSELEYVQKESFFSGILRERRSLSAVEIAHIFSSLQFNTVKIALAAGFAQVAQAEDVKKYFKEGQTYNLGQNQILIKKLAEENISHACPSNFTITSTAQRTFSDKLMLFHISQLSSAKVRNYGDAVAVSPRHDLVSMYGRFVGETGKYAEDGAELMIKYQWLEQPPHAPNRKGLMSTNG